ncbi:hypothetical protein F2Q69_00057672 [Brassica cretica]|uniref:Uncharacterized protein n=1 Tax=Brassica cretica TaxID=69181 RepID=A0A8S9NCS5_BRACR|nr:hypothetical protein F2Q69_00057672 [Brassica cretica]
MDPAAIHRRSRDVEKGGCRRWPSNRRKRRETKERAGWRPTVEGTVGHRKTEQKRASEKKESVGREYREK